MAIGEIKIDIDSLVVNGDKITPGADVQWKILACGTAIDDTNLALQIERVSDGNVMNLTQKNSSDTGQFGILCTNLNATADFTTAQIPLIIDDTLSIRLAGAVGAGSFAYVAYVVLAE